MIEVMSEKDIQNIADQRKGKYNLDNIDTEDEFILITFDKDILLFGYFGNTLLFLDKELRIITNREHLNTVSFRKLRDKYGFSSEHTTHHIPLRSDEHMEKACEVLERSYTDPRCFFYSFDFDDRYEVRQAKKAIQAFLSSSL